MRARRGAIVLAMVWLCGWTAWAAGAERPAGGSLVFTPEERRVIKDYYSRELVDQARRADGQNAGKSKGKQGLPPGLAKRETLPPGLQRQLQKNGTLPPGLEKKIEPLPRPLEERLRTLPSGTERVVIGRDVILLDKTTQKILDIIRDVAILGKDIVR